MWVKILQFIADFWPRLDELWPLFGDWLWLVKRLIVTSLSYFDRVFQFLLEDIGNLFRSFVTVRMWISITEFIVSYWKEELVFLMLLALFSARTFFTKWKRRHLASYAAMEIGVGIIAIAAALPWPRIFDLNGYSDFITLPNLLKICAGIYTGVRGQENWEKARARNRLNRDHQTS
jgi:hypothetical protein